MRGQQPCNFYRDDPGKWVTCLIQGRQFVSIAAGNALFTFALQR